MIHSLPESRAQFSFSERRLGATGPQITQGIYTGIESGAMLVPVVGPFVAAAAAVANAFGLGKGCGVTCTQSTQIVNQIEPILKQNLAAAQQQLTANGGCLMPSEVAVLVQNFQTLWSQVLQGCGQIPAPGGTQCIADRQPGGKFDWTAAYLAPIQQMPVCPATPPAASSPGIQPATTVPTPAAAGSSTGAPVAAAALASTIAGFPSTYVYLGIGALALFLLVKK
jgi:hypothetical protein